MNNIDGRRMKRKNFRNGNKSLLTDEERFLEKIEKSDDCWIWVGSNNGNYGVFRLNGKQLLSHRVAYSLFVGDIPNGKRVCHKCDNTLCVNPSHLFIGTAKDNSRDMVAKGRSTRGARHPGVKLSRRDIVSIREMWSSGNWLQKDIAQKYNISRGHVCSIINKRDGAWSWL